ncbi:hypothetical protein [Nostoc sp.]|uniref:hypothetical protein n=1 Tax=Nostoc sp. TaxID=1180 RepID=UPI002FF75C53
MKLNKAMKMLVTLREAPLGLRSSTQPTLELFFRQNLRSIVLVASSISVAD